MAKKILFFFYLFMLRPLKKLIVGDMMIYGVPKFSYFRRKPLERFYKKSYSKKFPEICRERSVLGSLLKHPKTAILKRPKRFPLNSEFSKKQVFRKTRSCDCFCSLKNYFRSMQYLPLECSCNNLKTQAKKFVSVRFQTCI